MDFISKNELLVDFFQKFSDLVDETPKLNVTQKKINDTIKRYIVYDNSSVLMEMIVYLKSDLFVFYFKNFSKIDEKFDGEFKNIIEDKLANNFGNGFFTFSNKPIEEKSEKLYNFPNFFVSQSLATIHPFGDLGKKFYNMSFELNGDSNILFDSSLFVSEFNLNYRIYFKFINDELSLKIFNNDNDKTLKINSFNEFEAFLGLNRNMIKKIDDIINETTLRFKKNDPASYYTYSKKFVAFNEIFNFEVYFIGTEIAFVLNDETFYLNTNVSFDSAMKIVDDFINKRRILYLLNKTHKKN